MPLTIQQRFTANIDPKHMEQFASLALIPDLFAIFNYYVNLKKFKLFYGVCRQLGQITDQPTVAKRAVELWKLDVANNDARNVYLNRITVSKEYGKSILERAPFETTKNPYHQSRKVMYLYSKHICMAMLEETKPI